MVDIRKIVKNGYEKGDYVGHFRTNQKPNAFEKNMLSRLASLIPASAKILDLGCGIGIPFDKYLADKGFRITGVDIVHKHIIQAKKNIPNAMFFEDDFSKKNFGDERFNAIIALYTIFHIPRNEQGDLFNKMYGLLENGGVVLMTLGTSKGEGTEKNWTGAPMAWSNFDPTTYKVMLNDAGFEITYSKYEGKPSDEEYHWWVISTKK